MNVTDLAANIRLLLMDVDGVLTDGHLYNVPGPNGEMAETKGFDSQDGIGLQWLSWYGIRTGVISGRVSPATQERARQCKMAYVYQGHIEKIPILEEIAGWDSARIRAFFATHGLILEDWDKIRTDSLTIRGASMPPQAVA